MDRANYKPEETVDQANRGGLQWLLALQDCTSKWGIRSLGVFKKTLYGYIYIINTTVQQNTDDKDSISSSTKDDLRVPTSVHIKNK